MINEKDSAESGNGSIPPQKEAELPKSKGQLRLVPYESLLSPSFLHAERVEEDASTANQSPISPSKTSNKPQAMVAIPERNLEDLNILARTLTAGSAPTQPLTEAGNLNSSKISMLTLCDLIFFALTFFLKFQISKFCKNLNQLHHLK